jgi:DNA-binding GntR family transcriptional regulator
MSRSSARTGGGGKRYFGGLEAHYSLAELAYRAIRESIISGEFQPGEQLVEARLAEHLGISRVPIREALRRLAEEYLVVERPRFGVFVRGFTASDFVDIYNLRLSLETMAVRLIIRRRSPTENLERLVEQLRQAADDGDVDEVVEVELRFHEELCAAAGNEYLNQVFASLKGVIRIALSLDDAAYGDLREVAAEHVPLLQSIRSGTEERAVAAIQSHILDSVRGVVARLGGEPADLLAPLDASGTVIHDGATSFGGEDASRE